MREWGWRTMQKFTRSDFDSFPVDEYGFRICPSGDYSEIKHFPKRCRFGELCRFGEWCSFGEWCRFGEGCSFGEGHSFGELCSFGERCSFDEGCSFGELCSFGERCRFGKGCSFGERCSFGEGCSHEGLTNSKYIAVDRIGSEKRKTYFFAADEGYFVRAGCWFGSFDKFAKRVKKVHAGTKHEKHYLAALELAKMMLGDGD